MLTEEFKPAEQGCMVTQTGLVPAVVPAGTPLMLTDLWRRRLDTLVSGIANRDPYYLQLANAAEHISAEYHGRFLIELIQNANDQAVRQGLTDSLVTIHRTRRLLAVGNSGQPFDEGKVEAITSIFKSDKTADECIGNKGIGFKAVFQVADSAEIFSAVPGGSLAEGCATSFRMVRKPFEDALFLADIRRIGSELLHGQADRRSAIERQFPREAALDVVMREAGRAAWFSFPLPCVGEYFCDRVAELELSDEVLRMTQTLIVLALDDAGQSSSGVGDAIDEVQQGDRHSTDAPSGNSFLFLPGIAGITIVDRARGFRVELEKRETTPAEILAAGVTARRERCICRRFALTGGGEPSQATTQDWWVVERLIGEGDDAKADQERKAIREAIQALRLPEENWKGVEKVPVAVAIPGPAIDGRSQLLGANGRFCIGLPTRVQTGLPLWVNAHFHGKIDRTEIDFDNGYNHLLFEAAVELVSVLLERLKREPGEATKRLVTLALERGPGELADALYSSGGLAHTEVVLGEDDSYVKASDLLMPRQADLPMFQGLVAGISNLKEFGFRLPNAALLGSARVLLDGLAKNTEAPDAKYLEKTSDRQSLLEHAASSHRLDGPEFWEPFLTFVLERFSTQHFDVLSDQLILPIGKTGLASAQSRIFFPPMRLTARATDEEETPQAVDDAGDELAAIDETVASLLKFFDDSAVIVRTGTARDYTPLAQKLAPDTGRGLIRRPRQEDLINDALIPAMRESRSDNERMLALLRQALFWLVGAPQKSKLRVATDNLLVPVGGAGDAWAWAEPRNTYLGEGWENDPNIGLLTKAFGNRPNTRLVSWDRFEKKVIQRFKDLDRNWWLERLKEIGVSDCPRIIRTTRPIAVADTSSYLRLSPFTGLECPVPCPESIWKEYLTHIAKRRSDRKTGQFYYLDEIAWIDGLEDDSTREAIVEAMLRKPGRYDRHRAAKLARHGGEDSTDVVALWVFALRHKNWPVIPSSRGLSPPGRAWFLPLESRSAKSDRFAFLPCVTPEFSAARAVLRTLGVITIEEAPIPRLVKALHEIAEQVKEAGFEDLRQINALASDLYEAIQLRLKCGEQPHMIKKLLDAPVPLLRGERIGCVGLQEVAQVWVQDDLLRRRYISGWEDAWVIPSRFQNTYDELVSALRELLGRERVPRVSEAPFSFQFVPLESGTPLLDFLRQAFPIRRVAEDLGLLILKGGTQASSPHDEVFRQAWGRVARTRVIRGTFEGASPIRACFDAQHEGGPTLLVGPGLNPHEIVGETWQIVGASYRPIWAQYAQSLREGTTDRFFEEYGVSSAERMEVEVAIGLGFEQRLRRYQPVWLALWRRSNPDARSDGFHLEWEMNARTAEMAAAWLNWSHLQGDVEQAGGEDEPQGSLFLLRSLTLSVLAWQSARRELGETPWRFAVSERRYLSAREAVAGHVMAWFAYVVVPRASGASGPTAPLGLADAVGVWAEGIRTLAVPADVAEECLSANAIIARVAEDALRLPSALASLQEASVLLEPLRNLASAAPSDVAAIKLKDEPDKAATAYERDDLAVRAQQAAAAVEAFLKIAVALAPKHGEQVEVSKVQDHPLVALLSQGVWANRVSVLAAVRYALESAAPATATRMKDRHAFRDFDEWRVLWKKFEELGDIPTPAVPPQPKPRFDVIGLGWTRDDFSTSTAAGPVGEVAQRLAAAVDPTIDLAAMRAVSRAKVQIALKRPGSGGGGGTTRKRVPDEYLAMLGVVGEYFAYQQLKVICPDLDVTNWKSKAREAFGYDAGDDSLGYDFAYNDVSGILVGRAISPRCLIEVKSAAHDGGSSFEMSTNEWEVATRCHQDPGWGTYVILRVFDVASKPRLSDILVNPVQLHLDGILDYASRDLLVVIGKAT